ncbi:CPBP family intramembrane glutamic endopeptidase [Naasia sp. SYSU D00948]|uniref:CPBP family intramembrane glutamic endopeptidase n=1 Tax=Naasia sp. SYSU D00948 TaxID=2817379 RepID=UPI001B3025A4|nr:CPBP family intramembrane glutamic endopeptidase [Naasia sp. SYSU D00948]
MTAESLPATGKRRLRIEIVLVLGLSLGASAVYSIVALANRLSQPVPISEQTATLNPTLSERPVFDLVYQLLGIGFDLVPVALALYLLWQPGLSAFTRIGFDATRPLRDAGSGLLLAAAIGLPGLALYAGGRLLGITPSIATSGLSDYWWTIPVLVLSALRAALTEELIVVGYLFTRLRELGVGPWATILSSAILRGSYHLYQGVGSFAGNVAMGIVFGWVYSRWGRTTPLVVAHFVLDVLSFVGYPLALAWFPGLFNT